MTRRVLITGAAKRIGAAIARRLSADGWAVAVHANSSLAEAEALAAELRAAGGEAVALAADLGDIAATEALVPRAAEALGQLDALVNNASLFELDRPGSFTAESWERHMAVNLRAPALLARDLARRIPEDATGCIVNLLDQKLFNMNPDFWSYTISKYGLLGMTRTLATAWAPRLRVCGVAPGLVLPSPNMTEASFRRMHAATPLGRGPSVEDVVAAVVHCLQTPGLTGETLVVDGGESLQWRPRDVLFDLASPIDGTGGAA